MKADEHRQPSTTDLAVDKSLVKSGTFALLVSLALLASLPYWQRQPLEQALGQYISLRLTLKASLDELRDDPRWEKFASQNNDVESMTIERLHDIRVKVSSKPSNPKNGPTAFQQTPKSAAPKTVEKSPTPMPPTNITATISGPFAEISTMIDCLQKLGDPDLLTKSRSASGFYNVSVFRWSLKRLTLWAAAADAKGVAAILLPADIKNTPQNFVPPLPDNWASYFTLRDAEELAAFELPTIPDTTKLTEVDATEITPSGFLPRGLYPATLCAEILLFLLIVYFEAFVREAVASPRFPAAGTLFGALGRSPWTLFMFVVTMLLLPAAASSVAIAAKRPLVTTLASAIGIETILILIRLFKAGYLGDLLPARQEHDYGVASPSTPEENGANLDSPTEDA